MYKNSSLMTNGRFGVGARKYKKPVTVLDSHKYRAVTTTNSKRIWIEAETMAKLWIILGVVALSCRYDTLATSIPGMSAKIKIQNQMWGIKFDPLCLHGSCSPSTVHDQRREESRGSNSNAGKIDQT